MRLTSRMKFRKPRIFDKEARVETRRKTRAKLEKLRKLRGGIDSILSGRRDLERLDECMNSNIPGHSEIANQVKQLEVAIRLTEYAIVDNIDTNALGDLILGRSIKEIEIPGLTLETEIVTDFEDLDVKETILALEANRRVLSLRREKIIAAVRGFQKDHFDLMEDVQSSGLTQKLNLMITALRNPLIPFEGRDVLDFLSGAGMTIAPLLVLSTKTTVGLLTVGPMFGILAGIPIVNVAIKMFLTRWERRQRREVRDAVLETDEVEQLESQVSQLHERDLNIGHLGEYVGNEFDQYFGIVGIKIVEYADTLDNYIDELVDLIDLKTLYALYRNTKRYGNEWYLFDITEKMLVKKLEQTYPGLSELITKLHLEAACERNFFTFNLFFAIQANDDPIVAVNTALVRSGRQPRF